MPLVFWLFGLQPFVFFWLLAVLVLIVLLSAALFFDVLLSADLAPLAAFELGAVAGLPPLAGLAGLAPAVAAAAPLPLFASSISLPPSCCS